MPFENRALGDGLAGGRREHIDELPAAGALTGRSAVGRRRGASPSPAPLPEPFAPALGACSSASRSGAASSSSAAGAPSPFVAAGAPADSDPRDHLTDGDGVALLDEQLSDCARGGRGQLDVDLVGRDLDDRLVELDRVASLDMPFEDCSLGDRLARGKGHDVDYLRTGGCGHSFSTLARRACVVRG